MFKTEEEFNQYFDNVKALEPRVRYLSIDVTQPDSKGKEYLAVQTWEQYKREMESMGYIINE